MIVSVLLLHLSKRPKLPAISSQEIISVTFEVVAQPLESI